MTPLQEAFLSELKSKTKFTAAEYAALYKKHSQLAIEHEEKKGASEPQARTMGHYYTVSVLSDFIANENLLARIMALHESSR
jgi:hypothetical protein